MLPGVLALDCGLYHILLEVLTYWLPAYVVNIITMATYEVDLW